METYQIQKNTPLWGVVQLLNFINDNSEYQPKYSDIEIAQNPNSGFIYAWSEDWSHCLVADRDNNKPERHYFLYYSGLEFFESEAVSLEFSDLHEDDREQLISILEELGENERAEEIRNYSEDV